MVMIEDVHSVITPTNVAHLALQQTILTEHVPWYLAISTQHIAAGNDRSLRLYHHEANRIAAASTQIHDNRTWVVVFSPDETHLAAAGGVFNGTIHIWRVGTSKPQLSFNDPLKPTCGLAYHPNADIVAGAGWGGMIWFWDAQTGQERAVVKGHETMVRNMAFSPDGVFFASAGGIFDGNIKIWYVEERERLHLFDAYTHLSSSLAYSYNGRLLASGGRDRLIKVWETVQGKEVASLRGHTDEVRQVVFSPDARLLASCSSDKTIRLWDVERGRQVALLTSHKRRVRTIAFSPDGAFLLSGGDDKTLCVWALPQEPLDKRQTPQ